MKHIKTKISILFKILFHETLHHTTTYFYKVKVFPKVTNTHLYINQKETKQKKS
jgi:hypothetical protein